MCFNLYALIVNTKRRRYLNLKHPLPQTPHAPFPAYPLSEYHIEAPLFSKCSYTYPHRPNPTPLLISIFTQCSKSYSLTLFRAQALENFIVRALLKLPLIKFTCRRGANGFFYFHKIKGCRIESIISRRSFTQGQVEAVCGKINLSVLTAIGERVIVVDVEDDNRMDYVPGSANRSSCFE